MEIKKKRKRKENEMSKVEGEVGSTEVWKQYKELVCTVLSDFFFQAEDGIRDRDG